MHKFLILVVLALMLSLVACGGDSSSEGGQGAVSVGDPVAGEALFVQTLIGSQPGCITCHSLEPGVTIVGPSIAGIGAEAGSRVSGQSAEEYLRLSITDPGAYLVEGFAAGLMPAGFADELSEEQLNDLVAYMLSLK